MSQSLRVIALFLAWLQQIVQSVGVIFFVVIEQGFLALVRKLGVSKGWHLLNLLGHLNWLWLLLLRSLLRKKVTAYLDLRENSSCELHWNHQWLLNLNGLGLNSCRCDAILLNL